MYEDRTVTHKIMTQNFTKISHTSHTPIPLPRVIYSHVQTADYSIAIITNYGNYTGSVNYLL